MRKHGLVTRRGFLGTSSALGGALGMAGATGGVAAAADSATERRNQAFRIRRDVALLERDLPLPDHPSNGDEDRYANRIGSFSKGLPHNDLGEVDPATFEDLRRALISGDHSSLEKIRMGWPDPAAQAKFINPHAGRAFNLVGADSHHLAIPPAPAFASAEAASEAAELYWKAALRDVPFLEYQSNALAAQAAADLSRFSDFRGPKIAGRVTPDTLFRGFTAGDATGPYISQFLWKPVPFGPQSIDPRVRTTAPGLDYMTDFASWLSVQRGWSPPTAEKFTSSTFIRTGRDLANWVHHDVLFQAYFNACNILLADPDASDLVTGGGMGAPFDPGNPYSSSRTQTGFGTFGPPAIAGALGDVAPRALMTVWYQKWFVHRRLRPEAFGGRVHNRVTNRAMYPVHAELLNSAALARTFSRTGTYLLPQAYPEGCPLHPSYGAGHATVAGACVTILKAFFDESFVIPNPAVPSADGQSLVPYKGPDADSLTVGSELNKLASNVGIGRNFAGIHWRSDYAESLKLGEALAISLLRDLRLTYSEEFEGFQLTKFDGTTVTV